MLATGNASLNILVVNPPTLRLKNGGACEQDRLAHLSDLVRLGHRVTLITQLASYHKRDEVQTFYREMGVDVHLIDPMRQRVTLNRFTNSGYMDGAAWELGAPVVNKALHQLLDSAKFDLMWCHASYSWAPAYIAKEYGLRAVIRSVNYEPLHHLQEAGFALPELFRSLGKVFGERQSSQAATLMATITPNEQAIYERLNPKLMVKLLPLRKLPQLLRDVPQMRIPEISQADGQPQPLRVFFLGSSYNVPHNLKALRFIVDEIIPKVRIAAPKVFEFHMMGSKMPTEIKNLAASDLIMDGFVDDIDAHLSTMDIALIPSLSGAGMQQKVFEPLCRGFPTITHERALAGYRYRSNEDLFIASSANDFVSQLIVLRDPDRRRQLAASGLERSRELFSRNSMDERLADILDFVVNNALTL